MHYIFETSIGRLKAVTDDKGALMQLLPTSEEPLSTEKTALEQQIQNYLAGKQTSFDIQLNLKKGTPFQQRVWQALCTIPFGQSLSYADVAEHIGHKRQAARAIGQAVGSNPCLLVVPCHRVLAANTKLGGFSAGIPVKKHLLKLEGIAHH